MSRFRDGFAWRCRARWQRRNPAARSTVSAKIRRQAENCISRADRPRFEPSPSFRVSKATDQDRAGCRARPRPAGHDLARRTFAANARARRFLQNSIASFLLGRLDFLEDFENACAAFDGIVEMED